MGDAPTVCEQFFGEHTTGHAVKGDNSTGASNTLHEPRYGNLKRTRPRQSRGQTDNSQIRNHAAITKSTDTRDLGGGLSLKRLLPVAPPFQSSVKKKQALNLYSTYYCTERRPSPGLMLVASRNSLACAAAPQQSVRDARNKSPEHLSAAIIIELLLVLCFRNRNFRKLTFRDHGCR